jgi:EAL domain-containing protein (putative c-di-GMP-specific phosphodiesterase class I)
VSPAQLRDPFFPRKVAETLAATGFPASRLSLEITEGHLIDDPERAAAAISGLKGMGVRVVLDDFGTGYTSIAYLQKYRFDAIKIDRSLASRIEEDAQARVLVTGVIYLANGLNMSVTAEGVETEEQATLLRLAGCTNLQGYRFHMPKPLAHWVALAERRLSA